MIEHITIVLSEMVFQLFMMNKRKKKKRKRRTIPQSLLLHRPQTTRKVKRKRNHRKMMSDKIRRRRKKSRPRNNQTMNIQTHGTWMLKKKKRTYRLAKKRKRKRRRNQKSQKRNRKSHRLIHQTRERWKSKMKQPMWRELVRKKDLNKNPRNPLIAMLIPNSTSTLVKMTPWKLYLFNLIISLALLINPPICFQTVTLEAFIALFLNSLLNSSLSSDWTN